jgi:hypothetical protein
MITPVQRSMLVRLSQFSRNLRYFTSSTSGKPGDMVMSSPVAEANLKVLTGLGFLKLLKTGNYYLTDSGRRHLDAPSATRYDRVTNGTQTERYEPKPWESARAGADDHLQYQRKGF